MKLLEYEIDNDNWIFIEVAFTRADVAAYFDGRPLRLNLGKYELNRDRVTQLKEWAWDTLVGTDRNGHWPIDRFMGGVLKPVYSHRTLAETCAIVVPDFAEITAELLEYFAKHPDRLPDLHWRQFELLLQRIFANQGYDTEVGPGYADGGVDLRLIHKDGIGEIITLVQAKKYSSKAITIEAVQALYGAVEAEGANRGLFVTTSRYLPGARRFAAAKHRKLILADSVDVSRWCLARR